MEKDILKTAVFFGTIKNSAGEANVYTVNLQEKHKKIFNKEMAKLLLKKRERIDTSESFFHSK